MRYTKLYLPSLLFLMIIFSAVLEAGDLQPSQSPASSMRTLQEVYEQTESIKINVQNLANEVYLSNCTNAPVPKTGQFQIFSTTNKDDGFLKIGVPWSTPRFSINSNGTITDNLTGLVWLKNANFSNGEKTWAEALNFCNNLADDNTTLTDGSSVGDWRLPNLLELESIIDIAYINPCVSNTEGLAKWSEGSPFTNIQSSIYWSSTITASDNGKVWTVHMGTGVVDNTNQSGSAYVWAVRNAN